MSQPWYIPQEVGGIDPEGVDGRFNRDYEQRGTNIVPEGLLEDDPRYDGKLPYAGATDEESDDRRARELNHQSDERQARLYVDRTTGVSETGADHPVKDVLWEASAAKDTSDPNYPTESEIETAYEASIANDNLPPGMFGDDLPIGR